MLVTKQSLKKILWKSMGPINKTFFFFYVQQKKEIHSCLEQLEGG